MSSASSDRYVPSLFLFNPVQLNSMLFFIPYILLQNSKTSWISPPLRLPRPHLLSLLSHVTPWYFLLIPSHSSSPLSHLLHSIMNASCAFSTNQKHIFCILTCCPPTLSSSHPISFHSSFHSHPPPSYHACFFSSCAHVCLSLLSALPSTPITVAHYSCSSEAK